MPHLKEEDFTRLMELGELTTTNEAIHRGRNAHFYPIIHGENEPKVQRNVTYDFLALLADTFLRKLDVANLINTTNAFRFGALLLAHAAGLKHPLVVKELRWLVENFQATRPEIADRMTIEDGRLVIMLEGEIEGRERGETPTSFPEKTEETI